MSCVYLTSEDILVIAEHACDDMQIVVRDAGLLESAAHRPSAAMFGEEAYPDLIDKAAALLQSLAVNHPLFDGNKPTAWLSCVTFLAMNGVDLRPDIDAAERLVIDVATGETDEIKVISQGLRDLVVDAM
ncbi:type II toxin-antitoxin system death-on-curing family toxin [Streptomyces bacillaris]|uniref:Type II toxin-antitoxin system death-on-curing family toxin n=1 Tax=Streptomyces cavourensis TaxID=67258 RepID=A0AAD0VEE8_9ACTN|nr:MULTISPECIES: type II toxin-antitoxin system death-on-curing family toxin [Streptomyces]NUW22607.1 type II toxin-antitoxin system death-on-curing family toxin [Streptomyces roseoviolaceus]ATY95987.1 type II toxin-antitoxin system death-on-curing family toxin [Streptomyces cavourensis]AXI71841.1 type II toxin-antitoxin system death-on-curing family toxin [Streptomyces cavourensis]NUV90934.1 type II toxin-antitoxin system death-on-curing family toxin [Streptomyces sp. KAI-26]TQO30466.1 death-